MGSLFSRQSQLSMDSRMPLGDGTSMPVIGFGTYQVKNEDCLLYTSPSPRD